ncbi:MAG: hypothetical protein WD062_02310 [Chloroflexota bacterium]
MLPSLLVLGVIGTGLAYLAWFCLLDLVSLVFLGAVLFLVPITGVVAGSSRGTVRRCPSSPASPRRWWRLASWRQIRLPDPVSPVSPVNPMRHPGTDGTTDDGSPGRMPVLDVAG